MGYRTSVTDSVSVGEMMHMRNVLGMSNGEIAERIGCCSLTVRRAIGPHPEGKRRARRKKEIPLPPPVLDKVPEMPRQSFRQRCEEVLGMPEAKVDVLETTVKTKADLQKCLDDMVLLFGRTAVKGYLRCFGYLAGTKDGVPVLSSDQCFDALRKMEGE